ncbi:MAG: SDR family oxidoreductase [Acidobacteria bacterium]|nr:SDR family oxidoreductase [Acidobacteriota bacterium]
MDLSGRVVLVAGGAGGMGLAIARAFADEGGIAVITDLSEAGIQKAIAESKVQLPLHGRVCDVTDRNQVADLFAWLMQEFGTIDILVNSAGINVPQRMLADIDPADFDRVLQVNTTGTFNCMHYALPVMREKRSGLIVNICSIAGIRVMPMAGVPYCVSKFATGALGTFANLEEAANGIKVTNIYPGETNTPILDERPSPPPPEKRARMLQPEDIAACVIMVARLPARAVVPELVVTPPYMLPD